MRLLFSHERGKQTNKQTKKLKRCLVKINLPFATEFLHAKWAADDI